VSGDEDGRFGIYFDVANTGRLPITIEGLGGDEGAETRSLPGPGSTTPARTE
jgi:hypothetical protein